MDLSAFMDAWVNRKGFPLISIDEHTTESHPDYELYVVNQMRFGDPTGDATDSSWRVPVRLTAVAHDDTRDERFFLLEQPRQVLTLPKVEGGYKHIKLNAGHKGYYRTTYSSHLAERLFANIGRCALGALRCPPARLTGPPISFACGCCGVRTGRCCLPSTAWACVTTSSPRR
jgi:aminopeptidase N